MRERLAAYGIRNRVEVLPTGIPLQSFAAGDGARFREHHGIEADRTVALYVGRLAHEKNIGFLLESAGLARTRCPRLLLMIAGEGPAEAALKARVAASGLEDHVRFMGYLDRSRELPDCYAAADIFVFASRTETQGLVLIEAMASGLPVLALACMGTRSILASGRGTRTAPDDPGEFAKLLNGLLADPQQLARLGEEARVEARQWSDDEMASRLATLYRNTADLPATTAKSPGDLCR
jgi:glycosyltransferase involved in cell wall biosynthesis